MIRKVALGFALVAVLSVAAYVHFRQAKPPLEIAYAGNREVVLMNTTAMVRQPVASVNYGERLDVVGRYQDQVQVRTMKGLVGWVGERELLSADLWQKSQDLGKRVARLPVEARGHTRVLANLHIEPGRDSARISQLNKQIPVELFERRALEVPTAANAREDDESGGEPPVAKKEDWWLVRTLSAGDVNLAGWILGRFIALDVPSPLPDYASSSGIRIVAWFELNRVKDSSGSARPQYLVAGQQGPEGQPCDFTLLRAYTWGVQRQRYETAYVEGGLCGRLPVKIAQQGNSGGDVSFSFQDLSDAAPSERIYQMHQTIIRRVKGEAAKRPARNKRGR